MKITVINPVIKNIDPIFSPVPVNRLIKGQNGIVVFKRVRYKIGYSEIALLSVFSQKVDENKFHADGPLLLIFIKGSKRPFLFPAIKIDFTTFFDIKALNLKAILRNFIKLICKQNPFLILDRGTAEFISGKGVKTFDKDISGLSTALGRYLENGFNSKTDKKSDGTASGHSGKSQFQEKSDACQNKQDSTREAGIKTGPNVLPDNDSASESKSDLITGCFLLGILFVAYFLSNIVHDNLDSTSVTGTIIKSEIIYSRPPITDDSMFENYSLSVEYFYIIDNVGYKNDKYYYLSKPQKTRKKIKKLLNKKYALGKEVPVYYDPAAPAQGVLVRGVDTLWWKIPVIIVIWAIILWILFIMIMIYYSLIANLFSSDKPNGKTKQ